MLFLLSLLIVASYAWSREDCQRVAEAWKAGNVPYAQSTRYNTKQFVSTGKGPYRSDCSGFVSAAWDIAAPGQTTRTITHTEIDKENLQRCDALLGPGHIALFWGWQDAAKTKPIVVEEYSTGHFCEERKWSSLRGYQPIRRTSWGGSTPPPPPPPPTNGGGLFCKSTATVLNIRNCAGTNCQIIDTIVKDEMVSKLGAEGTWAKIKTKEGLIGYASSTYLTCMGAASRLEEENNNQGPNVGIIVGATIGGDVALVALIGLVFLVKHYADKKAVVETA